MSVSSRGLRAFRSRPASRRQRSDLVTLAHIKEQSRLSLGRYGRPRMTEELKEIGLKVGHRRVGRFLFGDLNITCQAMDAPERHICCQIPLPGNTCLHVRKGRKDKLLGHPKDALPASG